MKSGDRVIYQPPGMPPKYGVATSEVDKFNRIGVQYDCGGWGYCWAEYVSIYAFERIEQ